MGLELHGFWVLSGQDETTMERDSMRNIWTERERIKAARVAVYQSLCDWLLAFSVGSSIFFSFFFFFFFFSLLYFFFYLFFYYYYFFWILEVEVSIRVSVSDSCHVKVGVFD